MAFLLKELGTILAKFLQKSKTQNEENIIAYLLDQSLFKFFSTRMSMLSKF